MLETTYGAIPRLEGSARGRAGSVLWCESFCDRAGVRHQPEGYQRRCGSHSGTDARCAFFDASGAAHCFAPSPLFGGGVPAFPNAVDACARVCLSAVAGCHCNR